MYSPRNNAYYLGHDHVKPLYDNDDDYELLGFAWSLYYHYETHLGKNGSHACVTKQHDLLLATAARKVSNRPRASCKTEKAHMLQLTGDCDQPASELLSSTEPPCLE